MISRTVRDFSVPTDIWPTVERWAKEEGFELLESSGSKRIYRHGSGLIVLPTMLEISAEEGQVHLETWIKSNPINRLLSLLMTPNEIALETGGITFAAARSLARKSVNRLLVHLGQPLIA